MSSAISRRGFLRGRFAGGTSSDPSGAGRAHPVTPVPRFRPPGAVSEAEFLEKCTACDRCIDACPHNVLHRVPAGPRSLGAAGTPVYDPGTRPCLACPDRPCVTACDTGALLPERGFGMGVAAVDEPACLAHQGTFCSVCIERCPEPGAIVNERGKPRVDAERCTGCGICFHVCPAPAKAILLRPAFVRSGS